MFLFVIHETDYFKIRIKIEMKALNFFIISYYVQTTKSEVVN